MASIRWGLGTGAELCLPFTGNATLSGCRVVGAGGADDDIALSWNELATDANTVGLWQMNGDWTDTSGNGHNGTASGATFLNPGWLDQAGKWDAATDVVSCGTLSWWEGPATVEAWVYMRAQRVLYARVWEISAGAGTVGAGIEKPPAAGVWDVRFASGKTLRRSEFAGFSEGAWLHIAATFTGVNAPGQIRCWINGVEQPLKAAKTSSYTASASQVVRLGNGYEGTHGFNGEMDGFRLSNSVRYTSNFTPVRYKSAAQNSGTQPYAQASYSGLTGMIPAAVSWSATTGSGYGQVKRVWVNDLSAGWVQVGGDYPTSPVSVSGLVLPSADAVRVELEPEQVSGIQNETPVLDWVQLEYTAASTGRPWLPVLMQSGRYA